MPLNVSAVVNSSTEITVYWQEVPPFNRNGVILFYKVLYRSALNGTQSEKTADNTTFTLLLNGLREHVEYNITVQVYTVAGAGEESTPIVMITTLGDESKLPRRNITFYFLNAR